MPKREDLERHLISLAAGDTWLVEPKYADWADI